MNRSISIVPAGSCWEAKEAISDRVIFRSPTKRDIVLRTFEFARKEQKCKVTILNHSGHVEEERLFDENPEKKLQDFLKYYQTNL
ncbi:MAG: hypothetical protein J7604_04105 [Sporocytophaga sp.]|uniref:hypothetical protein n=1 Tax=Sporocytophaga sp. TaxID=2231183 RepID=UPI001AFE0223|nr:hypothetical protein [Sporocytophaga sp.]MBO9699367.1 hypothetical protein [Sporocytophaga sp.]